MKLAIILAIVLTILASVLGGVFILKQEREIVIENNPTRFLTPGVSSSTPGVSAFEPQNIPTSTPEIQNGELIEKSEDLIAKTQALILETQKFIDEKKAQLALIVNAKEKSSQIKGIYIGRANNQNYFKELLDETELNGVVIDIKETYGTSMPDSLKGLIFDLHKKDVWVIARIVVFRDSSLIEEKPDWHLAFTSTTQITTTTEATATLELWRDDAGQYWLDPKNEEVVNYIIEFSKKAIDYGFDELQFDYIRYPDDYEEISGQEKIEVIGDFFSKLSSALRDYKSSVILSADLFGYVATQFNSYGTGQRLFDAGKYFDYISFMLYPSHFYGGFAAKGIIYFYPDVVKHPYEVVYYSVFSARDYLALFGSEAKIRPWLQNFDLKADRDRQVFYDAQKVRLQIEGAVNATSSGWLLWNPSNVYTKEALYMVE